MAQAVRFAAPGVVVLIDTADLRPGRGEVGIRTLYSGISTGTERTAYLGSNPYLSMKWDESSRLFTSGETSLAYPIDGWGYEESGEIVSVGEGVSPDRIGQRVWGLWGHRSDAVMPVEQAVTQRLPDDADPRAGVFARPGAVALNAIIDSDLHVGETVAIFGQGVIGLLATKLASLSGARVIAVDAQPQRLSMSQECGAEHVVLAGRDSPAEYVRELTGGRGADVCIEISGAYPALHEAVRTVAYAGRVVASGFYQGGAGALSLGEEFHHNRVEMVSSQISNAPTRYGNRWSKERLHIEIMRLITEGKVDAVRLISHMVPAAAASDAFALIEQENPDTLQIVLDFQA